MDWATVSALATGGGTLVLAVATFGSVKSANRAARAAERSVLAGLRPLLMPSRPEDAPQKVGFADARWMLVPGGQGAAEATDEAVYLVISVRNVGTGIAVLHGWYLHPDRLLGGEAPDPADFTRLSRDLYIPAGDVGFWQGTFRDPTSPGFKAAAEAITRREHLTIHLLYGDYEGGQRMVTRFGLAPRVDDGWIATVSRHWNIDNPDPR